MIKPIFLSLAKNAEGAKEIKLFYKKFFAAQAENRCGFARTFCLSQRTQRAQRK